MGVRAFLALDLDEGILDGLAEVATRLDDPQAKIRWVSRRNQHLTLHFLGDVADEKIADVFQLVSDAAGQVAPFNFGVRGTVCVPPRGQVRMVWANVLDPAGRLAALHQLLAEQLTHLDLPVESRRFKPHITLARIKSTRNSEAFREAAAAYTDKDFGTQHVSELVAYASQLTTEGPIYTPLARRKLGQ